MGADLLDDVTRLTASEAATRLVRRSEQSGSAEQNAFVSLDWQIAAIDALLSEQVSAILHHPVYQRLEASWRGLLYLTDIASGIDNAKVRVLAVSWDEIAADFDGASEFDQSELFDKIYSQEFGMPGGKPFGLIIADYAVQHVRTADHPADDVTILRNLAGVGAAAFTPIILGAAPLLLQVESFRTLGRPFDVAAVFRQTEYTRWNSMREAPDIRFVGVALPRILMRLPYTDDNARYDGFRFQESSEALDGSGHLWGSAAYAFGAIVLRAFGDLGWFAEIRGAPRDEMRAGIVDTLCVPSFATDRQGTAVKPSTECLITNVQENDLSDLGFIVLRKVPLTDLSVFNECPSLQIPKRYDRQAATVNARISSMLHYMLCVSRFAHYIKVLGREEIGKSTTAEACQDALQRWLFNYVASSGMKAPLREANVVVRDVPGRPGSFDCQVRLVPHFQIDDISAGFELKTEIAPVRT